MDDIELIKIGALYRARTSLIGSGVLYNEAIENGQIVLLYKKEKLELSAEIDLYLFSYIQNAKDSGVILTVEKFNKYFEKIQ